MTDQQSMVTFLPCERVKLKNGSHGSYVVISHNKDGSVAVYGGIKHKERYRSFKADRLEIDRRK